MQLCGLISTMQHYYCTFVALHKMMYTNYIVVNKRVIGLLNDSDIFNQQKRKHLWDMKVYRMRECESP